MEITKNENYHVFCWHSAANIPRNVLMERGGERVTPRATHRGRLLGCCCSSVFFKIFYPGGRKGVLWL